jgi:hypothetical protein
MKEATRKVKLLESMLIDGEHRPVGETVDVPERLARELVAKERAAPVAGQTEAKSARK